MMTIYKKRLMIGVVIWLAIQIIARHWVTAHYSHVYVCRHVLVDDVTSSVISTIFVIYILIFCRGAQHGAN
jgi:hypothetical protein